MGSTLTHRARSKDDAVSPVVGTILMVAVTVALAATVLAVMNGFGSDPPSEASDAAFKAQAVDGSGNGLVDAIKLTYITGPTAVPNADAVVTIGNGTANLVTGSTATSWSPGDFRIYDTASGSSAGTWFVTVSLLGTTVFDGTITLQE